eukprot:TRINITY_DN43764_c0_g1_i2.p2 TRINITY_DN43764_c0_g1~~TRINITY_DN43764_c0_g1_i2.p2  ORF type:complete len:136 (-),score=36.58 TRINITY_DN43764_c0_g1_i2:61-468(-)
MWSVRVCALVARADVVMFFFLMIRRPPRSTQGVSSAASDVYKRQGDEVVQALAYDIPVPGYNTFNTNNLRLWRACPSTEFDFRSFNTGDYFGAVKAKQKAESISSVLYPNDMSMEKKKKKKKKNKNDQKLTLIHN